MYDLLTIKFCSPLQIEDTLELRWKLHQTMSGALWQKRLINLLENKNQKIYSRFGGFPDSYRDHSWLKNKINECIDFINQNTSYKIAEKYKEHDQDIMNKLHHHFEVMIGQVWNEADFFREQNEKVKDIISAFNYYIHEIEMLDRIVAIPENVRHLGTSSVFVEFIDAQKFFLPEFCFSEFVLDLHFGDIYLHYAQTGKTWIEVFLDNDQDVEVNGINPLACLSGEFDIFFGNVTFNQEQKSNLYKFVKSRGGDPTDPKSALGQLVVASLESKVEEEKYHQLKHELSKHQSIREISLSGTSSPTITRRYEPTEWLAQDYQLGLK